MTKAEVQKILDTYNSKDWNDNPYFVYKQHNFKKVKWFLINNVEEFSFVRDILTKEVKKLNDKYFPSDFIILLIYDEGDYFARHKDQPSGVYTPGGGGTVFENKLVYSAGYLLNDDFEGGDFMFEDKKLEAEIGELFYFSRDEYHEIKPVTKGRRFSLHFTIDEEKNSLI